MDDKIVCPQSDLTVMDSRNEEGFNGGKHLETERMKEAGLCSYACACRYSDLTEKRDIELLMKELLHLSKQLSRLAPH